MWALPGSKYGEQRKGLTHGEDQHPSRGRGVRVEERLERQEIKGNEVMEAREGRAAEGVRVSRARCCQEVKQDVLKVGPLDVFTRTSPYSWEKQFQRGER